MTGQDMEGCACDFLISAMGWIEGAPSPDPPRIAASRSGIGGNVIRAYCRRDEL